MAAPVGNKFWKLRSKHGREKLFASPELLWEAACEYFEWCDENPLLSAKTFCSMGEVVMAQEPKVRAYTLSGLCLYLNASRSFWYKFKSGLTKDEGYFHIIDEIEETIFTQKFEAAAAGLLKENIISRELGLADKRENDVTSAGQPIQQLPPIIIIGEDDGKEG